MREVAGGGAGVSRSEPGARSGRGSEGSAGASGRRDDGRVGDDVIGGTILGDGGPTGVAGPGVAGPDGDDGRPVAPASRPVGPAGDSGTPGSGDPPDDDRVGPASPRSAGADVRGGEP